jgi:glutamate formiminotransferase / 5-formyltetrahydrofolate cyclo-ligase
MRILTVPNWSFGRDKDLLNRFREVLEESGVATHYLDGDVDHNRTVSAFSGDASTVFETLERLCELAFDRIDLNHHVGVHPRIGALDVCPFLPLPDMPIQSAPGTLALPRPQSGQQSEPSPSPQAQATDRLLADVEAFAAKIAGRFELPIFLYEKSERGRHEADLPSLRKGGFGGLIDKELHPDFGPSHVHPKLGVSVVGVRDPLIAVNVNMTGADPVAAQAIAQEIRALRASGDNRFLGVRALGFSLASVEQSQVSLNLTLPDITAVDPIIEWVLEQIVNRGRRFTSAELVGVIREGDVPNASRLPIKEPQIVGP